MVFSSLELPPHHLVLCLPFHKWGVPYSLPRGRLLPLCLSPFTAHYSAVAECAAMESAEASLAEWKLAFCILELTFISTLIS